MTLQQTTTLKKGQQLNLRDGRTGFFRELTGTGVGTQIVMAEKKGAKNTFSANFRQIEAPAAAPTKMRRAA